MQLRVVTIVIASLAVVGGVACGGSNGDSNGGSDAGGGGDDGGSSANVEVVDCSSASAATTVDIESSSYAPSDPTVSVGDVVKWTNNDSFAHTVTSGDEDNSGKKFDSGDIDGGGTWCLKFSGSGDFPYYCTIHGSSVMSGTVTVQ